MIEDLKPYPTHKDSGVPWLGHVPEHWDVLPNRATFTEVKDRNFPDEEMLSVTIAKGVMRQADLLANSSKKDSSNENKSKYKLIQPGDIAYNKMRAWQGAVGVSNYRGIVSPAYIVARLREPHEPKYFHYLYRTPSFAKEAERWSYGISSDQWSLRPEEFKQIYTCIPPLEEQAAIVRFLNHADRRIRCYIRTKQKLIQLLNEQKQAIIHRAVTNGLGQNVELKTSTVEWIGNLPRHWDTLSLARLLTKIEQGWSPVAAEGELSEDQWAVLTLSSVKKGTFHPQNIKPVPVSSFVPSGIEVHDGDFLLTRSNTRELVGDVCIVTNVRAKTILCDLIYRLTINKTQLSPRFLSYFLLSPFGRRQVESDARGSSGTMPKISQGHIRRWKVCLPPIDEQVSIAAHLDEKCKTIEPVAETACAKR